MRQRQPRAPPPSPARRRASEISSVASSYEADSLRLHELSSSIAHMMSATFPY